MQLFHKKHVGVSTEFCATTIFDFHSGTKRKFIHEPRAWIFHREAFISYIVAFMTLNRYGSRSFVFWSCTHSSLLLLCCSLYIIEHVRHYALLDWRRSEMTLTRAHSKTSYCDTGGGVSYQLCTCMRSRGVAPSFFVASLRLLASWVALN